MIKSARAFLYDVAFHALSLREASRTQNAASTLRCGVINVVTSPHYVPASAAMKAVTLMPQQSKCSCRKSHVIIWRTWLEWFAVLRILVLILQSWFFFLFDVETSTKRLSSTMKRLSLMEFWRVYVHLKDTKGHRNVTMSDYLLIGYQQNNEYIIVCDITSRFTYFFLQKQQTLMRLGCLFKIWLPFLYFLKEITRSISPWNISICYRQLICSLLVWQYLRHWFHVVW